MIYQPNALFCGRVVSPEMEASHERESFIGLRVACPHARLFINVTDGRFGRLLLRRQCLCDDLGRTEESCGSCPSRLPAVSDLSGNPGLPALSEVSVAAILD
jgi:hypothetical protein